jgi:hypothetical protein
MVSSRRRSRSRKRVTVDRIEHCSLGAFYEHYLSKRKPVIFTGLSVDWPARKKWTWRSLAKMYGATQVRVNMGRDVSAVVPLSRYIDYVQNPGEYDAKGTPYLRDWNFLSDHPEMAADFTEPFFANDWLLLIDRRIRPDLRWVYAGPNASKSPLHIDTIGTHAWLAQLIGKKRWKLFSPSDVPESYLQKGADAFRPDRARFPRLTTAACWEATLEPGEIIFVPYGWRHQIENDGPSLALTGNYVDASNYVDCVTRLDKGGTALRAALEDILIAKCKALHHRMQNAGADASSFDSREVKWERRWLRAGLRFASRRKLGSLAQIKKLEEQLNIPAI